MVSLELVGTGRAPRSTHRVLEHYDALCKTHGTYLIRQDMPTANIFAQVKGCQGSKVEYSTLCFCIISMACLENLHCGSVLFLGTRNHIKQCDCAFWILHQRYVKARKSSSFAVFICVAFLVYYHTNSHRYFQDLSGQDLARLACPVQCRPWLPNYPKA